MYKRQILNYVFEGLTTGDKSSGAVGIIAFILVVGGAFGVVLRTGAIESGIMRVIDLTLSLIHIFMPLIAVALVYLTIVLIFTKLIQILERRLRQNER